MRRRLHWSTLLCTLLLAGCGRTLLDVGPPPAGCGDGVVDPDEECDDGNTFAGDGCDAFCRLEGTSVCGDGIIEGGEECDDGNVVSGDGCDATCRIEAVCGNGAVEPGEECDDGNLTPGDGCDAFCRREAPRTCGDGVLDPDEECDDGNRIPGDGCDERCRREAPAFCGNGRLDPGEECDDGNTFPGDGCSESCRIEPPPTCGDGALDPGEECDDGNLVSGDGCDARCRIEAPPTCGDGVIDPGEECDDGNTRVGDGCDDRCRVEPEPVCGNGTIEVGEECDDGNTVPGDGCDELCRREAPPRCGNGVLDPGEECDDGNTVPGDGCDAACMREPVCGNGTVEGAEECDDGNTVPGDGCDETCRVELPPICGDGSLDPGEECDDGNILDGDGCDALCRIERCETDVVIGALPLGVTVTRVVDAEDAGDEVSACGDGDDVLLSFEVPVAGDLELEVLQLGDHRYGLYDDTGDFRCTDSPVRCFDAGGASSARTVFSAVPAGRYYLIVEEDRPGAGGVANVALTLLTDPPATCGDGSLDPDEVCDDGNTVSGDGCRADCLSDETCGNGALDAAVGEVCDDGNTSSGDGCSADCRSAEVCGNGVLDAGELCDDGNRRPGDGCSADCSSDETCGNGVVDAAVGEECDDGDVVPGDGCDASCRLEVGMCAVDEDLGALTEGVPVRRTLDVASASDLWDTDCSTMGPERVLSFRLPRPGNVAIRMTQSGHHNIGIYREGQVTDRCVASMGLCGSTGPGGPLGIRFLRRPAGNYFAVIEANGAGSAGTVDLSILWEGCRPSEDVGILVPGGAAVMRTFDTTGGTDRNRAACAGDPSGREHVLAFQLDRTADVEASWSQAGDHVLGLFSELGGNCDENPVACHDPVGMASGSTTFPRLGPGRYVLVVDAHDPGDEGRVTLTLSAR
ncbi:MAG TPA: DUF4215 domain-containing protein [Sandaracinaceae bacterium LLY-WYZ-13_1]|nr:DUF4215 domain-containing protein [Sandaracinaceae bacterium LLY-WYZ-13_1]